MGGEPVPRPLSSLGARGAREGRVLSTGNELLLRAKFSRGSPGQCVGGESAQVGFLHVLDAQQKFELLHWYSDGLLEPKDLSWELVRNPGSWAPPQTS